LPDYTQVDNESCFSGGFTHPGVLGKVLRLGLMVGMFGLLWQKTLVTLVLE